MSQQSLQNRLTLQEYLLNHSIRKKVEQRNRSKSKTKQPSPISSRNQKNNIFGKIDSFLYEIKVNLSQILDNYEIARSKVFYHIAQLLDKLMMDIKEEISLMYKDVYNYYIIEKQVEKTKINPEAATFFKEKMDRSRSEYKKQNLTQVRKENMKVEQNNNLFMNLILGMNVNPTDNVRTETLKVKTQPSNNNWIRREVKADQPKNNTNIQLKESSVLMEFDMDHPQCNIKNVAENLDQNLFKTFGASKQNQQRQKDIVKSNIFLDVKAIRSKFETKPSLKNQIVKRPQNENKKRNQFITPSKIGKNKI